MAYVYTIAFYEQGSFVHLEEGVPIKGMVTNDTIRYYYFDIRDLQASYEIALTPISGNPDLVLSYTNKFPDRENYDFISEKQFSTDSIIISKENMDQYLNE